MSINKGGISRKKDRDDRLILSRANQQSWDDQTRALEIHKKIKAIQDRIQGELALQGVYDPMYEEVEELIRAEKPSKRVMEYLKTMYSLIRPLTEREKLQYMAKIAVAQYIDQNRVIESHAIPLTLSIEGLYKEPKETYLYPLRGGDKKRIFLIRFLNSHGPCASRDLLARTGYKTYGSLTDAIYAINKIAQSKLNLPEGRSNDLIVNSSDGYMINPLFPITEISYPV
jgi:hypothetical protein